MPDERRRHVRKRVDLQGILVKKGDETGPSVHVADLSVGGAFLETDATFPFGTEVTLEIDIPASKITVPATVRWAKPGGCGVQFGNLGVKQTYAITQHLAAMEPMPDSRRF